MSEAVEIEFECMPLRSVARFDPPLDAPEEERQLMGRIRHAAERHGAHNTYYLYEGTGRFRLTNDPMIGTLEFSFEGVAFTDPSDQKTLRCELHAELTVAICDWLTAAITEWFVETLREAVRVEFDRYIAAGDLARTLERLAKLEAEMSASGGYVGLGI